MPTRSEFSLQQQLFLFWLLALAFCLALFCWAFTPLNEAELETNGAASPQPSENAPLDGGKRTLAEAPPLPFDPDKAACVLTAFSTQGMRHVTDAEPSWSLLRPGNVLVAQLVRRDPSPVAVSGAEANAIRLRYTLDAPYAKGQNAEVASGELRPLPDEAVFVSDPIPVTPYPEKGLFAPYPTALVQAFDAQGLLLAETRVVLPVSTEMGCRNCHTGPWKTADSAGISGQTANAILETHDRRNGTRLQELAERGATVDCRSCHGKQENLLHLSAAVHGFHAAMKLGGGEACGLCHASAEKGHTVFYRDLHSLWGLDCTRCHGRLEEHALALLLAEKKKGKDRANERIRGIMRAAGPELGDVARIVPRLPGVNLPNCSGCHDFVSKPDPMQATAFNKWTRTAAERYTNALDDTGNLRCPSCHGAPHALYPAENPSGDKRDVSQPLQYQKAAVPLGGSGNCAVCHTTPMAPFIHHGVVE